MRRIIFRRPLLVVVMALALAATAPPPLAQATGNTAEYATVGGALGGRFPTEEAFVDQAYRDVFGRPADTTGLKFWAGLLRSGTTPDELVAVLVASPEFAGVVAPVVRLYYSVFDRAPDLSGLRFWVAQRRAGLSLEVIAQAFLDSNEFEALNDAANEREIVEAVYGRVLGRAPDPSGLAYWVGLVSSDQLSISAFVVQVSESAEHLRRRNSIVTTVTVYLGMLQRVPEAKGVAYWSGLVGDGLGLQAFVAAVMAGNEYLGRFLSGPSSFEISVVASGLKIPWDVAELPDGSILVTERSGAFRLIDQAGTIGTVAADLSDLLASGETGLLGLALDPEFGSNRRFYSCQGHTSPREIQVIVWELAPNGLSASRLADPLVGGLPISSGRHGGCQLTFDAEGFLIVGTGDSALGSLPQNLGSLGGKVLRVNGQTGEPPATNPFITSPNPQTQIILSYGHRNVQGVAIHPSTGRIWTVEHGPDRDDEVNLINPGSNYGWNPVPGYNENVPMTDLAEFPTAQPAIYSTGAPTLALSGADFIGDAWGSWRHGLAVAALKNSSLRIIFTSPEGGFLGQRIVISGTYGRLRAVSATADGSLLVSTSNGSNDQVLKITPR